MKSLIIVLGPTGVGKTDLCLTLADLFHTPIIGADSRQMYADIPVCTAAPTKEQMERVQHYFVRNLQITDYFSAARYEEQASKLIHTLFGNHDILLASGGSMMYIDSLCYGIDDIPTITAETREHLLERFRSEGLDRLASELRILDPEYYRQVDVKNPKRILHALEVCYQTGRPYSDFRTGRKAERPYNIIRIGLTRDREELYSRINTRVSQMVENGLLDEARRMYPYKGLNSLNTVGMKELFSWMDGEPAPDGKPQTLESALDRIRQNSRIYSRKQMTWFKRDTNTQWFHPDDKENIISYIKQRAYAG
ncbi:MAG: tRNA (adenosine(37)-N6)-dimethylallyltransferase MiaA [Bacteroidaceae bacterium]|nr:tRNA (adenosine(37)-N6)-dimethylallyltransferase MiaA [Bacteroidaceae bacterium]